jgi:hypothetical protein
MCPFPLSDSGWKHSSSFSSFLHFRQAQTYQKNGDRIHDIHYSQQKQNRDSSVSALLDDALNGRPQPQFNGDAIARPMAAPYPINSESKVLAGRQAEGVFRTAEASAYSTCHCQLGYRVNEHRPDHCSRWYRQHDLLFCLVLLLPMISLGSSL